MVRIQKTQSVGKAFAQIMPLPIQVAGAPATTDTKFPPGQVWLNTSSGLAYILVHISAGSAVWNLIGPGASDVDTINSLAPTAGNIIIDGGTNITDSNAGSTVTLNLDAAISLATSVTSPLYTVSAADLLITSAVGQDVIVKLGDNAGVQKFEITDSDDTVQFAVDSNGGLTMGAVTFTGLLTANASALIKTAGVALNLGTDNDNAAVNLGTGTTARTITIGGSGATSVIAIGNGYTGGSISMGAAMTNGTITIGGTGLQTGNFVLAPSTGGQTISLGNLDGAKVINIGAGVDGNTISIGNGINTSAQIINVANGASAANTTLNIMSGIGTAGAGIIAFGSNTRLTTMGICNIAPAAARTTTICGGDSAQNDTINVLNGEPSAGTQTVSILSGNASGGTQVLNLANGNRAITANLGGGTGGNTINVGVGINAAAQVCNVMTGASGADATVNIMTGNASAGTITLNMANGNRATAVNLGNGTGGNTLLIANGVNAAGQTVSICNGASGAAQTVNILSGNASAGTQTLNLALGTGDKTVGIATGAGINAVTIGSTNTSSSLILQSGTGRTTMTGTVKEINAEFLFSSGTDLTITQSPIMQSNLTTGAAPTGATGDVNLMYLQDGCLMEQFILGAGQTIIAPRMTANGLDMALDQTASEGAEYNFGAVRNNSKHAYTIGTSAAFFIEAKFYVTDYSGCGPLMIGFRKVEANNTAIINYTDSASIGINTATSTANATILSKLNGGGQTATDTTDALAAEPNAFTVKVLVSAAGVTTFEVDGSAASAAPSYTFDNTDVVVPFIYFLNGADLAGEVSMQTLKIGFQA